MTTLRQLAEAACLPMTPDGDNKKFHAATVLALLDTIDAQRKLLERVNDVMRIYNNKSCVLSDDITAHLEATK